MGTAIIVIILLLLCVYAGYSYRKKTALWRWLLRRT